MKILFVNTIQMFGGGEVWMLRAMEGLRARGHEMHLCCRPGTELLFRAAEAGFPVHVVNFRGDFDPLTILRLAFLIKAHGYEIILTNMDKELRLAGMAACLVRPSPVVIPRRGIDYPLKNRLQYRFAYNVLADRIIANSVATKNALLRNAPWLDAERIEVIYNGIETTPFEQASGAAFRKALGIAPDAPLVGFVGQLDSRKGIGVILTAFDHVINRIPQAKLVFVGEGPLREMIESEIRVKEWQDSVFLTGFSDDIPEVMQAIDLLILPSFWEGFGIVIIEAMAASKPVISTNISSMPEIIVEGETGFLIEPGDSDTLAERIIALLQDEALRKRMGEAGLQRVDSMFSYTAMINHLETLFRQELSRKRKQKNVHSS